MFARPRSIAVLIHVAQDNRHAARAEPLRNPRTHHTRADDSGVHDFLVRVFEAPFLIFVAEEKIANQVLSRVGRAQLADGIDFHALTIPRSRLVGR